jgi:2-hydroxy-4-carboxymuconate semialdehyde hemiacetal dehydrogenase
VNACVIGHGMTGVWHSNALRSLGCELHTLVGRRPEPTRAFAAQHGYGRWSTDLEAALSAPDLDLVIVAGPSALHVQQATLCLERGLNALVEIPLALDLAAAERLVALAERQGCTLGVVHPLRYRPELGAVRERIASGTEHLRHVGGRFFIHRLENVGASGYRRSWTDNLLWHHMNHLVDGGIWLLGDLVTVHSSMSPVDPATGVPMDAYVAGTTAAHQSLVCSGSYYGRERIFEIFVLTNDHSYRLDVFGSTLTTDGETVQASSEETTCALVVADFVAAVTERREPLASGRDTLQSLAVLEQVQAAWDARHGRIALPGRPLEPPS